MSEAPGTNDSPAGILLNPALPEHFFEMANETRSAEEIKKWWDNPIILTEQNHHSVRYDVWCLDGGAWDRPTLHGQSNSLEEAETIALKLKDQQTSHRLEMG